MKKQEPIEKQTREVSKRSATPRDSAFKPPEPEMVVLDLRFNAGLHCSRQQRRTDSRRMVEA